MSFLFRRSKKIGILNVTLSKSNWSNFKPQLGFSIGLGPFRIGQGGQGNRYVTTRTPIRGLRWYKHLGQSEKPLFKKTHSYYDCSKFDNYDPNPYD